MQRLALKVIRDEHQALAAMLRSMSLLNTARHHAGALLEFDVMRAMLFYVDEFPERLHHPKESQLLFPLLRTRCPGLRGVLDKLDADHRQGEQAIRELEHKLLAFEVMGEPRRQPFEQALERYVSGYLQHMGLEESQVLPAAEETLSERDWAVLDEAFASNADPLTGHPVPDQYRLLFSKIVCAVPAPYGLGPAAPGQKAA